MKVSDLINKLIHIIADEGDLDVYVGQMYNQPLTPIDSVYLCKITDVVNGKVAREEKAISLLYKE